LVSTIRGRQIVRTVFINKYIKEKKNTHLYTPCQRETKPRANMRYMFGSLNRGTKI
jgi:hypothetical protein